MTAMFDIYVGDDEHGWDSKDEDEDEDSIGDHHDLQHGIHKGDTGSTTRRGSSTSLTMM